jgi:hypothetical protein
MTSDPRQKTKSLCALPRIPHRLEGRANFPFWINAEGSIRVEEPQPLDFTSESTDCSEEQTEHFAVYFAGFVATLFDYRSPVLAGV